MRESGSDHVAPIGSCRRLSGIVPHLPTEDPEWCASGIRLCALGAWGTSACFHVSPSHPLPGLLPCYPPVTFPASGRICNDRLPDREAICGTLVDKNCLAGFLPGGRSQRPSARRRRPRERSAPSAACAREQPSRRRFTRRVSTRGVGTTSAPTSVRGSSTRTPQHLRRPSPTASRSRPSRSSRAFHRRRPEAAYPARVRRSGGTAFTQTGSSRPATWTLTWIGRGGGQL